jgi:hypothetical protein
MRKKHGSVPKIHTCSGPDSHNEQDTGTQGAITNGTPVPPPQVRTTPHDWGLAEQQKADGRLAVARSSSDDDDFCSGGPNNSSDDLRADAAAIRPSPLPSLERQGRAEGRRVEVSPWAAPAILSAEKPLPAAVAEGGAGSGSRATRVGEPGTRQLPAPRTANALPPDH